MRVLTCHTCGDRAIEAVSLRGRWYDFCRPCAAEARRLREMSARLRYESAIRRPTA